MKNFQTISENQELATELRSYLDSNKDFWLRYTGRQRTTHALRHTEQIPLIVPTDANPNKTTSQWNDVLSLKYTEFYEDPVLRKSADWIIETLTNHFGKEPEIGRIFFSKLKAGQDVDPHVDAGKYFDKFDRFHFVVQGDEKTTFISGEDTQQLMTGFFFWTNNHIDHYLLNRSEQDRIVIITDACPYGGPRFHSY